MQLADLFKWIWAIIFGRPDTSTNDPKSPTTDDQKTTKKSPSKSPDSSTSDSDDTDDDVVPAEPPAPKPIPLGKAPWLKEARNEEGTREIRGRRHNKKVVGYFAEAGFAGIKDDETAWCAAFANAMLERTGYAGSKSLAARSFLKWGKKLRKPRMGCIVVFKRGNSSWQGHVGFYVGESRSHIFVLGGNQSNQVNVSKYPKSKFLGYRWPSTWANSRTIRASIFGLTGTAVLKLGESLLPIATELKSLSAVLPWMQYAGSIVALIAFGVIVYARFDDLSKKGR